MLTKIIGMMVCVEIGGTVIPHSFEQETHTSSLHCTTSSPYTQRIPRPLSCIVLRYTFRQDQRLPIDLNSLIWLQSQFNTSSSIIFLNHLNTTTKISEENVNLLYLLYYSCYSVAWYNRYMSYYSTGLPLYVSWYSSSVPISSVISDSCFQ